MSQRAKAEPAPRLLDLAQLTFGTNLGGCLLKAEAIRNSLREAEERVIACLLADPEPVLMLPIASFAEKCKVSQATVVRVCRKMNFRGFRELKLALARDLWSPSLRGMSIPLVGPPASTAESIPSRMTAGQARIQAAGAPGASGTAKGGTASHSLDDLKAVARQVFESSMEVMTSTFSVLDLEELAKASEAVARCRRLEIFALGDSALAAIEASNRFFRIGTQSSFAPDTLVQRSRASLLEPGDVALAVSHSGRTKDVVECMQTAKRMGATTVCIVDFSVSPLSKTGDIKLFTTSARSTVYDEQLPSALSQLVVVDALFAGVARLRYPEAMSQYEKTKLAVAAAKYRARTASAT